MNGRDITGGGVGVKGLLGVSGRKGGWVDADVAATVSVP